MDARTVIHLLARYCREADYRARFDRDPIGEARRAGLRLAAEEEAALAGDGWLAMGTGGVAGVLRLSPGAPAAGPTDRDQ